MSVTTFLKEFQVYLIAYEQFVAPIAKSCARGEHLVTVAKTDSVKVATYHCCDGIRGTVTHSCIEHFLVVGVFHPRRHIHPIGCAVGTRQHSGVYCKERIS